MLKLFKNQREERVSEAWRTFTAENEQVLRNQPYGTTSTDPIIIETDHEIGFEVDYLNRQGRIVGRITYRYSL